MPVRVAVGLGGWCVGVVGLGFPAVARFGGLRGGGWEGGGGRCHCKCWAIRGTTLGVVVTVEEDLLSLLEMSCRE